MKGSLPAATAVAALAFGLLSSCSRLAFFPADFVPVAPPSFSVSSGTYSGPITVAINEASPGFTIRYTTDPNASLSDQAAWSTYTGPVTVSSYVASTIPTSGTITVPTTIPIPATGPPATELRAFAFTNSNNLSPVSSAIYAINYSAVPTSMTVKLWGGGGGGGADMANSTTLGDGRGGAGGGGGFAEQTLSVSPGQTFSLSIGFGGTPATYPTWGSEGGGMTAVASLSGSSYLIEAIAAGGGGGGSAQYGWVSPSGGGGGSFGQSADGSDGGGAGANGVGGSQPSNNTTASRAGGSLSLSLSSWPPAQNGFLSVTGGGGGGGSGYGGGASGSVEFNTSGNGQQSGGGGGGGGNYGAATTDGGTYCANSGDSCGPTPANATDPNYVAGCGIGGSAGTSSAAAGAGASGCAVVIFQ